MKDISFIFRWFYAALCSVYLFTIGVISAKNRALIGMISAHFGLVRKANKVILPVLAISELAPGKETVRMIDTQEIAGGVNYLELFAINKIVAYRKPVRIFEIGTFAGGTTVNMAANAPAGAKIFTLDLPNKAQNAKLPLDPADKRFMGTVKTGAMFAGTEYETKIEQLHGDSAVFDFTPYAGSIDMVFIDGSHSYDYVMNDTCKAKELLRNGKGIIVWHDYGSWKGVTTALNDLYEKDDYYNDIKHIKDTTLACLIIG